MDILLKLQCPACHKRLIVEDADVDQDFLTCPFCDTDIPIPDSEDDD